MNLVPIDPGSGFASSGMSRWNPNVVDGRATHSSL